MTVKVKSKMEQNQIEIGRGNSNNTFVLTFNIETEKIELKRMTDNTEESLLEDSVSNQQDHIKIILRNEYGVVKEQFILTGDSANDLAVLKQLHQTDYHEYDTLEFETNNSSLVKFKGQQEIDENLAVNARYQITDYGLKLLTKPNLSIELQDEIIVKRGELVDPLAGIVVEGLNSHTKDLTIKWIGVIEATLDDNSSSQSLLVDSQSKEMDGNLEDIPEQPELVIDSTQEGEYTIQTIFVDSWGNEIVKENKVKIVPRDDWDSVKFKIKEGEQEVLTLALDSIEDKMRIISIPSYATPKNIDSQILTTITGYDLVGNKVADIVVKTNSTPDSLKEALNSFDLRSIETISVISPNPDNVEVTGTISISDSLSKQQNKIFIRDKKNDLMHNTRLQLYSTTNSVEAVYNQAPEISGHNQVITYYNGSVKRFTDLLSVNDDLDGQISSTNIDFDDSNVNYDNLGQQSITFTVSDSWGRQTSVDGKISIRSGLENSYIELHALNEEANTPVVALVFNNGKMTVEERSQSQPELNPFVRWIETISSFFMSHASEVDEPMLPPTDSDESVQGLEITLFDKETNTIRQQVILTDTETATSNLSKLHNQLIKDGMQLSIKTIGLSDERKTEVYKKIKIYGSITNQKEDYTDGVDQIDNLDNVRLTLSNRGFISNYNEAPKIYFQTDDMEYYLGDQVNFDYGLLIRDDYDGVITSNYEVKLTGIYINSTANGDNASQVDVTESTQLIPVTDETYFAHVNDKYYPRDEGIYQFTYTVTDSWGRITTATRPIKLKNALSRNIMSFENLALERAIYVGFNMNNKTIVSAPVTEEAANKTAFNINPDTNYYEFQIFGSDKQAKTSKIVGRWNATLKSYSDAINSQLSQYRFEYGDYIKIYAGHPKKFAISTVLSRDPQRISGTLVNGREDYSDGIDIASSLVNSVFTITPYGLVSTYTDPFINDSSEFDILSWTSPEKVAANLKIGRTTHTFSFVGETSTQYLSRSSGVVFTVTLYDGSTGAVKYQANAQASDKTRSGFAFYDNFNAQSWTVGDYFEIVTAYPKRIAFRGNVIGGREDYSDGVDTPTNLSKARFMLTNEGIKVVYLDAPQINGVEDYQIQKGTPGATKENILASLKSRVTATDVITGNTLPVTINEANISIRLVITV